MHGACSEGMMVVATEASSDAIEDPSLALVQQRASMRSANKNRDMNAEMALPAFIASALQQANNQQVDKQISGQCGIVWYYHIPKCAGTSMETWFTALTDAQILSGVIPLHTRGPHGILPELQQLVPGNDMKQRGPIDIKKWDAEFIEPFLQNPGERTIVVHHHDRGPGLAGMEDYFVNLQSRLQAKGCGFWKVTFLRNPVDLATSALFYYDHAEFGKPYIAPNQIQYKEQNQTLRFINALQSDTWYDNMLVRYLLNNKNDWSGPMPRNNGAKYPIQWGEVNTTHVQLAEEVLRDFHFVGIAEDIGKGKRQIADMIHLVNDPEPLEKDNAYEHPEFENLPGYLKQMILDRTQMDRLLYQKLYQSIHDSEGSADINPFRSQKQLNLVDFDQMKNDVASKHLPSTQDEPNMHEAILSKIEKNVEDLLFFAIDQDKDDLISIDECQGYVSNPHCMKCLSGMGFLTAMGFREASVTPHTVCQSLQIPNRGIDIVDFAKKLGQLQNDQGEMLAELIFSRDLLAMRRGEGASAHAKHLEQAMHEKDCAENRSEDRV